MRSQFPVIFNLTDLNGQNGFKIDGEVTLGAAAGGISGTGSVGDVNGDHWNDIFIETYEASPENRSYAGRSYIVFGGPGVGSTGLFSLESLNGTNGFRIDGEFAGDGIDVSGRAGDINHDGYGDILIGASNACLSGSCGISYLVFGGSTVGSNGLLDLRSLNGSNGFSITGDPGAVLLTSGSAAGDLDGDRIDDLLVGAQYSSPGGRYNAGSAYAIFGGSSQYSNSLVGRNLNTTLLGIYSSRSNGFRMNGESGNTGSRPVAADINDDGILDVLLGGPYVSTGSLTQAGRTYVLFGNTGLWYCGAFELNSTNGVNGFKIEGEAIDDYTQMTTTADINGDGKADIIFSSSAHALNTGRSYVLFGGPSVGSSGEILLSNLNGANGFKIDGESVGDYCRVQSAADINGDGIADLSLDGRGRVYVLFGGPGVGSTGSVALPSLNGQNGFIIESETSDSINGGATPDINGDGIGELMFASGTSNGIGRAYVVFGDISPQLLKNQLTIHSGETVVFSSQSLNATDNMPVNFNITNVQHGHFELISNPGQAITLFSQAQVLAGQVQFVHDGGAIASGYLVQMPNAGIALSPAPQAANITFYRQPTLQVNPLLIHQGDTLVVGSSLVNVVDDYPGNQVVLNVSNVQHGQFLLMPLNNSVSQFTEQQLQAGQVLFRQDNSASAPSYALGLQDPYFTVPPQNTSVTFYRRPVLQTNSFSIHQGEVALVNASLISITEDYSVAQVNIIIGNLQHGQFLLAPQNNSITQFTQQQLLAGQVLFQQDNTAFAPSYTVGLTDPYFTVTPVSEIITFYRQPNLQMNPLTLHQGQTVLISPSLISVTTEDYPPGQVNLTVSNSQHGQFLLMPQNNSVTQFTLQQLQAGLVLFQHDDTVVAPSYGIGLKDPYFTIAPVSSAVVFYRQPILQIGSLSIHQGDTLPVDSSLITATEDYLPNQVNFTVSNLQHGQFLLAPQNNSVMQFTEAQLQAGQVLFRQDNSAFAPSYAVGLQDPYFTVPPQNTSVTFYRRPVFINNQFTVARNSTTLITSQQLNVSADYPDNLVAFTVFTQYGEFQLITAGNAPTPQFTQQQVKAGQIQFHQDYAVGGSPDNLPSYNITVTDGYFKVGPVAGTVNYSFIPFPPQVSHPIPEYSVQVDSPINYAVPANTFIDPNNYAMQLSVLVDNSQPLPQGLDFDSATGTFSGSLSQAQDLNIAVTANDTAGLAATTYFLLKITALPPSPQPSSLLTDAKAMASIFGSLGGALLAGMAYLYGAYHFRRKREIEHPFANAIHAQLNLSYTSFTEGEGKLFAEGITKILSLVQAKLGFNIEPLQNSADAADRNRYQYYANLMSDVIRKHVKIYSVYCGTSNDLRLKDLTDNNEKIAQEFFIHAQRATPQIIQAAAKQSWCSFFSCCGSGNRRLSNVEITELTEAKGTPSQKTGEAIEITTQQTESLSL